jgi:hypothetical protein
MFSREQVRNCLDEAERELFRVADGEECQRFHRDTQLTAVLLLLLRASSLLRSLLILLQATDSEDGFHLVLRGFEETWNLAHELRLIAHRNRAEKWLARQSQSWSARIGSLLDFALGRGHPGPSLGRDYGLLSELSHPTRAAAENSVTLCGVRMKIQGAENQVVAERENCEKRIIYALYRLLWLILDQDTKFVPIPAAPENMRLSSQFCDAYEHIEPGT